MGPHGLSFYSDVEWARDVDTRRSTLGYSIIFAEKDVYCQ